MHFAAHISGCDCKTEHIIRFGTLLTYGDLVTIFSPSTLPSSESFSFFGSIYCALRTTLHAHTSVYLRGALIALTDSPGAKSPTDGVSKFPCSPARLKVVFVGTHFGAGGLRPYLDFCYKCTMEGSCDIYIHNRILPCESEHHFSSHFDLKLMFFCVNHCGGSVGETLLMDSNFVSSK